MRLEIHPLLLKFRKALRNSWGILLERELVVITLTDSDGLVSYGESAPLLLYDGVRLADVREALLSYRPVLEVADDMTGQQVLDECREILDLPQAIAAVDLALWDRAGRQAEQPVAALLAEDALERVPINATIGAMSRTEVAEQAQEAARAGYKCAKLKVGVGDDVARVRAFRAAVGSRMDLRLDANGAWSPDQAVRVIKSLEFAKLELVEEPVSGLIAMRDVGSQISVPIAMDETGAETGALTSGAADFIVLKIARCGGISGLLAQAAAADEGGTDCYIASTFDGPLGVAAGVHCAAALKLTRASGLGTLDLFAGFEGLLPVEGGTIPVPTAPGLGFQPQIG